MTPRFLLTLFVLSLFTFAASAERPPNFIIIFVDDLGYNDVGAYGSKLHRTPNIDRMAKEGRSFSDFYVTSGVCTPSRSSLMTGCYPKRIGMHENEKGQWVLFPGNKKGINPDEITLPEILKEQGYDTGIIGKWHLGDQPEFFPLNHGFDSYYGIPYSNDMGMMNGAGKVIRNRGYPPLPLIRDNDIIELEPDQRLVTQRHTVEIKKWIREHKEDPFFLYIPYSMPHAPQFSSENFEGKSANGKWGDAVEEVDWSVGEVFKELKAQGIDDNTMVVFLSDNGGAMNWGASNAPLRGGKGTTLEGGQRVPFIIRYPGQVPADSHASQLATSMDLLPTIAKLAGGQAPSDHKIDGKNIWPLLSGSDEAKSPHRAFYYYYRGQLEALRSGNWKIHVARTYTRRGETTHFPLQLYNLKKDIGESNNVAEANSKVVKRLEALLAKARKDLGDDHPDHKTEGKNTRPAGYVENAVILHGKPD
jgi:arylsulfatase A